MSDAAYSLAYGLLERWRYSSRPSWKICRSDIAYGRRTQILHSGVMLAFMFSSLLYGTMGLSQLAFESTVLYEYDLYSDKYLRSGPTDNAVESYVFLIVALECTLHVDFCLS